MSLAMSPSSSFASYWISTLILPLTISPHTDFISPTGLRTLSETASPNTMEIITLTTIMAKTISWLIEASFLLSSILASALASATSLALDRLARTWSIKGL